MYATCHHNALLISNLIGKVHARRMCFKIQKYPNSLISSHALIYLVHEFSPMALLIEWLAFLIKLHLIVRWFASQVGLFYLLTSEAPLLGLAKSIYYKRSDHSSRGVVSWKWFKMAARIRFVRVTRGCFEEHWLWGMLRIASKPLTPDFKYNSLRLQ